MPEVDTKIRDRALVVHLRSQTSRHFCGSLFKVVKRMHVCQSVSIKTTPHIPQVITKAHYFVTLALNLALFCMIWTEFSRQSHSGTILEGGMLSFISWHREGEVQSSRFSGSLGASSDQSCLQTPISYSVCTRGTEILILMHLN